MLVRYKINTACTIDNFKTDINNIIVGNIITVNDLSAGADKANCAIYGTYPAGTYARANNTTFTYSKLHNTENKTHYFRLNYSGTGLTQISLAESYESATDTLLNTLNDGNTIAFSNPYSTLSPHGFDVVVSNKLFRIKPSAQGDGLGINDIGHNAVTRQFANTMLMVTTNVSDARNPGITFNAGYVYQFETSSYVSAAGTGSAVEQQRKSTGNSTSVIFETPYTTSLTGAPTLVYGLFRIPTLTFADQNIYKDSANNYRLTFNDTSFLVD